MPTPTNEMSDAVAARKVRWIVHDPADAATNMAVDQVLYEHALERPTIRIYRWHPAAVSLGRFQEHEAMPKALRGYPWVRRLSGGGAILHRDELTYSIAFPTAWLDRPIRTAKPRRQRLAESYRVIHGAVAQALLTLGIPLDPIEAACTETARPLDHDCAANHHEQGEWSDHHQHHDQLQQPRKPNGSTDSPQDQAFLCYNRSASFDLRVGGRKLVGSAQRRSPNRILQHGSIPLGPTANASHATTAQLVTGAPVHFEFLVQALRIAFKSQLGIDLVDGTLTAGEARELQKLRATRYTFSPKPQTTPPEKQLRSRSRLTSLHRSNLVVASHAEETSITTDGGKR